MSKVYFLSKILVRLLYKVRHHRGHSIHSPFVFNFINRVIEERMSYYAYADIYYYLTENYSELLCDSKTQKLLFKIVNYFNSKTILELGGGWGENTLYLTAVSSDVKCLSVESDQKKSALAKKVYKGWGRDIKQSIEKFPALSKSPDCIYINLAHYQTERQELIDYLMSMIFEQTIIIVDGIRTNRGNQTLWRKLIGQDKVFISLDLFYLGIIFFDKKYFKRNYKLSF